MLYAQVIFNIAVPRTFTYLVPDLFLKVVEPGIRVLAPFGKRELSGVVVSCHDHTNIPNCREIIDVIEDKPLVSQEMLHLTAWMAEYYMCAWGQSVQLALPRGLEQKTVQRIQPVRPAPPALEEITDNQRQLYDFIFREPDHDTKFYRQKYGTGSFYYALQGLQQKGLVHLIQSLSGARVTKTYEKTIIIPENVVNNFAGLRNSEMVQSFLKIHAGKTFSLSEFREHSGLSDNRIKLLVQRDIIGVGKREKTREHQFSYQEEKREISLNPDQKKALGEIKDKIIHEKYGVFLLHGVTGSGKTQIYIEAIRIALKKGKTAVVLIPEISLTPQTVRRFENEFPGQVAVFHSRLSLGERYDTWSRVQDGKYDIVVGPRSALFMPLKETAVYVIDEEHDSSYKQNDPAPRYHARDVAIYLAQMQKAVVILGSATPAVESYHNTLNGKYQLIELNYRINDFPLPEVAVIDMRREGRKSDKLNMISPYLESKIQSALGNEEQVIILQNRRGFASFMQCQDCGHIPVCANCEIAYTYHAYNNMLQCHYCGKEQTAQQFCIRCGGTNIRYKGVGTEKIEMELKQLFPEVRLLRMDLDTTGRKGAHDALLQKFKSRQADILLGTQMIAKGLDFENVTVVGVISAEVGISLPDFRSSERVFQLLTQVAGRAGRGAKTGTVVIQSFSDEFPAIRHARSHDYTGFYKQEIERRSSLDYPPFSRLILIRISAVRTAEALETSRQIVHRLRRGARHRFQVLGPAPAPFSRLKNMYRWHVVLKVDRKWDKTSIKTKKVIHDLLGAYLNTSGGTVRVVLDVDPLEML